VGLARALFQKNTKIPAIFADNDQPCWVMRARAPSALPARARQPAQLGSTRELNTRGASERAAGTRKNPRTAVSRSRRERGPLARYLDSSTGNDKRSAEASPSVLISFSRRFHQMREWLFGPCLVGSGCHRIHHGRWQRRRRRRQRRPRRHDWHRGRFGIGKRRHSEA
jgi:hypothetical protein